ncbi:ubiquitin carboxyl-terminal hydrolase 24-like isoform X2 [Haliotis rufescens]|uniref:ubiquitin carboxyl-terminal hydrolase 24-like isoform X2 n=1 Tax=Haliotis rufescens TaxID=6454 RepID=UPI00201F87E1|nr:ubiquitin carboxyl-terminal hydrolase 24-like isoform X2 [Haliotis rufescens]
MRQTMDISEDNVQMLRDMGFPCESEVRRALRMAKNDLNEAVAILANDHPSSSYDTLDDVEMKDVHRRSTHTQVYGPHLPPAYDEVVESQETGEASYPASTSMEDSNSLEFPVTNLYELEGRVFTEMWNIPYKKEESLGKCLVAASKLAEAGLCESDEHCKRFMDRCMPEAFQKLLTSAAVHKWGSEIQEGIFDMLLLLTDLVVARLQHDPVPVGLLEALNLAFNSETEFELKNRNRRDRTGWEEKFEGGQPAAVSPASNFKDPYGWLTHLINKFANLGGLDLIKKCLERDDLDAPTMAAILKPFGTCAEFLSQSVVQKLFAPGMEKAIKYIQGLEEKDFKEKRIGSVSDLLSSMKLLCISVWPHDVDNLDELRLDIALRMLQSPHFNAKMNSLKEVTKLIEDSSGTKVSKTAMRSDRILEWLVDCKILSIALEGNIDQAQYCDKIKGLVDFLGSKLSLDELTMIWKMQNGQTNNVIDNIHSIMAAAAVKFEPQQLEHLFRLIQKKWQDDNDRIREKLLSLIGKIGKDARVGKTTTRVLELLWDLAHLPALSTHLIEQALDEHHAILSDSYSVKEQIKLQYVIKCVDDIKKGAFVLPALRQLINISKNIIKQSFHKADKGVIHELNKNCDVIKLVSSSLVKCHKNATAMVGDGQPLQENSVVDGRYTHADYMSTHLYFLQYVLQEGVLYLPWSKARDIWTTMVANPRACDWERETCYEWFSKGITDLEAETQNQLFQKEILRLDPAKLSEKGFTCFKNFFESVNLYEHKLKRSGNALVVEKCELLGLDYLWEICLNIPDETIASQAISLLLSMAYANLNPRIKKDPVAIHKKFISECNNRLEMAMIGIGGNVVAQTVSNATKLLTAAIVPEVANVPLPSKSVKLLAIERLLWIAEAYVLSVEEIHCTPRSILPHGASFHGYQINLYITCDALKQEFTTVCHSNESLGSVRIKVAESLLQQVDHVQIVANDKPLGMAKDQKLLHQLEFEDNQMLQVRLSQSGAGSSTSSSSTSTSTTLTRESTSTPTSKQTFDLEQEKMLPGYVMAQGGQVFEMLYQLTELDEAKITKRVRKLLMLIPTDPAVAEGLDSISQKSLKPSSSSDDVSSGKSSPRKSPNPAANSTRPAPKEVLKSLFDVTGPEMSAFRVLYNLEVVSGKLMPTGDDIGTRLSSQTFCDDFLAAGGLSLVVNVLQPESLPSDINYEIRQGCYSVCLQLARYLLCGETVIGDPGGPLEDEATPSQGATALATASPAHGSTHSVRSTVSMGSHAIKTVGSQEFTDTVSCFMKVTWAAAAGRLHLLSYNHPIRESRESYSCGHRSRQSSTGSSASTNSDSDCQSLHAGVCSHHINIPTKDTNIAKEALEILVTCLQKRPEFTASFYSLSCVSDFVIDLLVGCSQNDIRNAALEQFYLTSQVEMPLPPDSTLQPPHQFMLQLLLRAYLPFWVTSSNTRGSSQKLLNQCSQYFDLRCRLLEGLSVSDQNRLHVDVGSMLEDEIAWLSNFVPSKNPELNQTDNTLLGGHLKLIKTLLTCEGVQKKDIGNTLVGELLHDFLFPASKLMMDSLNQSNTEMSLAEFNPKCSSSDSRVAAYELLTELAYQSPSNLKNVCRQLLQMHHQPNLDCANEWEYMPPVDGRAVCGYVGLKNAGATCYMNSVLQQLYMIPGVPEAVLGVDEENPDDESVFYQMQQIFGHMMESRLQYHEPEKFWSVFKLWGQTINVREQQDAFDFFQAIIDQVDEHMKKTGKDEIFKKKFQGIFSDQKICKDCPHRYEREEAFIALNLTVKNATLQDSLDQFVKGELLEGDNAYYCEKCGEKRNTIKRMCIKTLPPLLCIQLKRFGYDWETNRALKFDDHFRFPWVLDMEPYTADGMARREAEKVNNNSDTETTEKLNGDISSSSGSMSEVTTDCTPYQQKQINYELVGVVVHSGQANAGHYYSYIRDRRGTVLTNSNKGKWFKFNDTIVEEFYMNDSSLEQECFGGSYKAKVYDQSSSSYPEDRLRYWNGYLLFYERMEEPATPATAKKSKIVKKVLTDGGKSRMDSDSLMELTELVHKGERKGIFVDKMPASIQQIIHAENVTFVKNRDVYNHEYFSFVKNLVSINTELKHNADYGVMCVQSLQLGVRFLFNTYLRNRRKTVLELDKWVELVDTLLMKSKDTCLWLVEYLSSKEGQEFIKPFLLECPNRDVRSFMAKILDRIISSFFYHGGVATHKNFDCVIEHLLVMLEKDVVDHVKNCFQYFTVIRNYVQMGTKACSHMNGRQGFCRLITFLLGQPITAGESQDCSSRRWSSIQSREFVNLHVALAVLIANCEVSSYRTEDIGEFPVIKPKTVFPNVFLKMSTEMEKYVFGTDSFRYLREVVQAVRELIVSNATITDMLLYCSFCNKTFSMNLVKHLMLQYLNTPSNELKPIFTLLTEVLVIEDSLQLTRLKWVIDGHTDESGHKYEGLIAIIRLNHVCDSRRSYQCIKFLVGVSNRCSIAKDYLLSTPSKWQWAVNWLKKKMTEHYWSTTSSAGLSNEDSNRKSFQRTQSAQYTLQEATALLTELENSDSPGLDVVMIPADKTDSAVPGPSGDTTGQDSSETNTDADKEDSTISTTQTS